MQITVSDMPLERLSGRDNLLQTRLWAAAKRRLGQKPRAFEVCVGNERCQMLALLVPAGDRQAAYVPWAPDAAIAEELQGPMLESLSLALAGRLPARTLFIRYDLLWRSPYSVGSGSLADAPDGRPPPRIRELRMNFGTRHRNLRKAPTDVQTPDTIMLDTTRPESQILASMRPKTRYNIRLAHRRGVSVRQEPREHLPMWYELYRETARRNRIFLHDYRAFDALLGEATADGEPEVVLLMARLAGEPLAGAIVAYHGSGATYLYGASATAGLRHMPSYAVQWHAVQGAIERGCSTYDLFGVPPTRGSGHPMHGLYQFKSGFGGRPVHRRGCWDFPLDVGAYEAHCETEAYAPGYHR